MVDRRCGGAGVVDQYRVRIDGLSGRSMNTNGHARLEVAQQVGMVVLDVRDHQAVHPSLTEAVYELALASGSS